MKSTSASPRNGPSGSPEGPPEAPPALEFYEPVRGPARDEAFLLLHGLNLNPDRLGAWRDLLLGAGFRTVLVRLRGHRGPRDPAWGRIRPLDWGDDLAEARAAALRRWPGAALSCFGYSLGGLLGLAWAASGGEAWRRCIWLCPALRPRGPWWLLLRLGCRCLPGRLELPSGAPRRYRLRWSTSVAAFRALDHWVGQVPQPGSSRWSGFQARVGWPQLLLYAPGDELVSTRWIRRYARELDGTVELYPLKLETLRVHARHLAIDPQTLGGVAWADMTERVANWIAATDRDAAPIANAPAAGGQP